MSKIRDYSIGDEPVPGYRLSAFLGSGGFGEVWRATAPGGADVAIKVVNLGMKGARKEFRSLKLIKNIRHPNLVPILAAWLKNKQGIVLEEAEFEDVPTSSHDALRGTVVARRRPVGTEDERAELIIAMGLGRMSLADRLDECKGQRMQGIPVDELLSYLQDAARAIDYLNSPHHDLASSKAIQHCDIKPPNILIVGDAAQVCDFSLAREVDDVRMTTLAGSLAFVAPEVLESTVPSPFTDQYSLAISYVELRTGELPFPPISTQATVMRAHLNSELDLSKLEPPEREVIKRATARNPTDRFPSTGAMVQALRQAVQPAVVQERRRVWPWLAAACLVLAASAAAIAFALRSEPTPSLLQAQLPNGFVKAKGAASVIVRDLELPDQIVCERHGLKVPFRLVYGPRIPAPEFASKRRVDYFYIMENKVSRGQYRRFAEANSEKVKDSVWEPDRCRLPKELDLAVRETLPVFDVTCAEAAFFARWLGGDERDGGGAIGYLPSVEEWDVAAGRYEPLQPGDDADKRGPFQPPWDLDNPAEQVGVARGDAGPLPVGTASRSRCEPFGCRDMAGNGLEWTRTPKDGKFDPEHPSELISMICRASGYSSDEPLRFRDFNNILATAKFPCTEHDCELGFRVVVWFVPPPEPVP